MSENVRSEKLTPKQRAAVVALLSAATNEQAAAQVGVTSKTLRRWRDQADFRAAVTALEAHLIDDATRRLLQLQATAIDRLEAVLNDPAASPAVRLRAAMAILDAGLRLRELHSIEDRLAKLEESLVHHA